MIGYIVSKSEYKKTDAFTVTEYSIENDGDFAGKSSVVCARKPSASEDDWFYMMDGKEVVLTGIIDSISNDDGQDRHTINLKEPQQIFSQTIILENYELLQTGIEDFVASCIQNNFTESDDELMNLSYITVTASTHTPVLTTPDNENGIFNLCTYMGNAMTNYGVFCTMKFTDEGIEVVIEKKEQNAVNVDCTLTDIVGYSETYQIDALSKLIVRWCIPEKEETVQTETTDESGNAVTTEETVKIPAEYHVKKYFLLSDRTITDDITSPDRAYGRTESVYIEAETEEKMYEEVVNQFKSNSYNHSVECSVKSGSKLFPEESLFVGAEVVLKTKSHGIHNSIVTKVSKSNTSKFIGVKFGNLKITLIEKIRKGMSK